MAGQYNFPAIKTTNTFRSRNITIIDNGSPKDLTGATVCMNIKRAPGNEGGKVINVTISDAVSGVITIPEFIVDLAPFKYVYGIKITDASGITKDYLEGFFPVTETNVQCQ